MSVSMTIERSRPSCDWSSCSHSSATCSCRQRKNIGVLPAGETLLRVTAPAKRHSSKSFWLRKHAQSIFRPNAAGILHSIADNLRLLTKPVDCRGFKTASSRYTSGRPARRRNSRTRLTRAIGLEVRSDGHSNAGIWSGGRVLPSICRSFGR